MYNRYIRNDNGAYTRIPQEEQRRTSAPKPASQAAPEHHQHQSSPPPSPPPTPPSSMPTGSSGRRSDSLTGFLRHILDQLHLEHVDTGDLLLLVLLFFLFREDADEELLVALGLLLIL